jgi:uncharacterized protein YwgA
MVGPSPARGSVKPSDWLLLLLALRDAEKPLDPVRLQKGLFLLRQEGGLAEDEAYNFRPYDYGPFSPTIYRDLQDLLTAGYVREMPVQGYNWNRYAVTPAGIHHAQEHVDGFDADHRQVLRQLAAIKAELVQFTFDELLRRVYDKYPDFAAQSVFR